MCVCVCGVCVCMCVCVLFLAGTTVGTKLTAAQPAVSYLYVSFFEIFETEKKTNNILVNVINKNPIMVSRSLN